MKGSHEPVWLYVSAHPMVPQARLESSEISPGSLREFFIRGVDNLFNLAGCPILLNQAI